jgi:short subunit dehydrogenase-like uncharacterized protein
MIYGANGYTGRLIAHAARQRGLAPILAGRDGAAIRALAGELDAQFRVFDLSAAQEISRHLHDVALVLHCAGPFSKTAAPMLDACLARKVHYLDITGEIDVFATCHRAHDAAHAAGVVVLPGAGFDVVPTDCLAAMLKEKLPDASSLVLAFEAGGGPSPGTAATSVEGLGRGGRARIDGEVRDVPLAWKSRTFMRDGQIRTAMTIPWGDVYTAFVSTGIPNIETYMAVSPKTIARLRWLRYIRPLLALGPAQRIMQRRVLAGTPGPSAERREKTGCHVWGEVRNADGVEQRMELRTPNGYDLTTSAALGIVAHLLPQRDRLRGGYYTPSQLMGAAYVLSLPGVESIE